uniref:Uncharacterized protein n=1 Tax=Arsenophonus endosymbiont of Trialeurodes vaporariorum TaxID=235567 RepID=A0A3B0MFU8_9GAMM
MGLLVYVEYIFNENPENIMAVIKFIFNRI